jgi:uncharacterized membrane protein YgdD (TMEM256/DUF423 family)
MAALGNRWIVVGSLVGAAGVGLGAFGAHGLEDALGSFGYEAADVTRRLGLYETAVRYHLYHSFALVLTGVMLLGRPALAWRLAAAAFLSGVALFSGLLYVLTFAGPTWSWLGAVVPIGGIALIVGWIALAVGAWK